MDLQRFVRTTISEVIRGINGAKDDLAASGIGAAINPVWGNADNLNDQHVLKMDFDVAITVSSKSQSEGGVSADSEIQVLSASLGPEKISLEHSAASRVKFSVPYIPPSTTVLRSRPSTSAVRNYDPFDNQ